MIALQSLISYGILVVGAVACAILFVTLKRDVQNHERRQRKQLDSLAEALRQEMRQMASKEPELPSAPVPPRAGFNLNKRIQAIHMLRRGEDQAHISAALSIPRKELELLVRVQGLTAARSGVTPQIH